MTVPSSTQVAGPFYGNGVTTSFPFTFKCFDKTHLRFAVATDGVEVEKTLDSDYSVTLNGDQDASPGGTITYPISGTPLAIGSIATIEGAVPMGQTLDLPDGGSFNASDVERSLDLLALQNIQQEDKITRALRLPVTAAGADAELPPPEANSVIGWDAAALALRNFSPETFASIVAYSNRRTLVANGGAATYTLAVDPGSVHNTLVAVGGVVQTPGVDYTVSGVILTPTTVWPTGTNNVTIVYGEALPVGTLTAGDVSYTPATSYVDGVGKFLNFIHARTVEETAAGITPTNYAYLPGDPRRYGAAGDCTGVDTAGVWGGTNDAAAVQAAVNALPEGGVLIISRPYRLSSTVTINKPITVRGTGAGSAYNTAVKPGIYPDASVKAFTLVARLANYTFGQWGIVGVTFEKLYCPGGNNTSGFITVDKTVNSGDFHIRECHVTECIWREHAIGVEFTGIAYMNYFTRNAGIYNTTAVVIERGAASDNGGQTRFFGGYYGLNTDGIKLNTDTNAAGGSFGFHGVTISENTGIGLQFDEECNVYVAPDCEIESNGTCGIYCEIKEANPVTAGQKCIGGKFIFNGGGVTDIWINKTTTAFSTGGFHFPLRLDNAYLGGSASLKIDVPSGHAPIDSPAFVLGRNIAGPSGEVSAAQISSNFAGTDERKGPYFKRWVIPTGYVSGNVFAYLPFGLVVTSARAYFTANASDFTSVSLGDQANNSRYLSGINAQSVSLNTWQTATISPPQLVIDNTNNLLRLVGTGGWLSAAAVVEVQGYVT